MNTPSQYQTIEKLFNELQTQFAALFKGPPPPPLKATVLKVTPATRQRKFGSRKRLNDGEKEAIASLLANKQINVPVATVAKMFGVSRVSIYNLRKSLGITVQTDKQVAA